MTVKTYDSECFKLAQHFLADEPELKKVTTEHALALSIQQAIEDHCDGAREQYERENGPRDTGDAWSGGFADNH